MKDTRARLLARGQRAWSKKHRLLVSGDELCASAGGRYERCTAHPCLRAPAPKAEPHRGGVSETTVFCQLCSVCLGLLFALVTPGATLSRSFRLWTVAACCPAYHHVVPAPVNRGLDYVLLRVNSPYMTLFMSHDIFMLCNVSMLYMANLSEFALYGISLSTGMAMMSFGFVKRRSTAAAWHVSLALPSVLSRQDDFAVSYMRQVKDN